MILQIYGRVQGVGFRYYTQKKAEELGIKGYVKNRPDGSVYVEAEGEDTALEAFAAWCETGPPWAHVRQVQKQMIPVRNYKWFEIK